MKAELHKDILDLLELIPDPEIPVLNIVELGIIRNVSLTEGIYEIEVTPTYSGCPATEFIEKEITRTLQEAKVPFKLVQKLSPPWTTDWITEAARIKLQEYGIAPPEQNSVDKNILTGEPKSVTCPRCKSRITEMISQFGSTPCKSMYRCADCLETFDYFKCI